MWYGMDDHKPYGHHATTDHSSAMAIDSNPMPRSVELGGGTSTRFSSWAHAWLSEGTQKSSDNREHHPGFLAIIGDLFFFPEILCYAPFTPSLWKKTSPDLGSFQELTEAPGQLGQLGQLWWKILVQQRFHGIYYGGFGSHVTSNHPRYHFSIETHDFGHSYVENPPYGFNGMFMEVSQFMGYSWDLLGGSSHESQLVDFMPRAVRVSVLTSDQGKLGNLQAVISCPKGGDRQPKIWGREAGGNVYWVYLGIVCTIQTNLQDFFFFL